VALVAGPGRRVRRRPEHRRHGDDHSPRLAVARRGGSRLGSAALLSLRP
jgi:hypothetical protein